MPAAVAHHPNVSARTRKQTSARDANVSTRKPKAAATKKVAAGATTKKAKGSKKGQKKMMPIDVIKGLNLPLPSTMKTEAPATERRVTFRAQLSDDLENAKAALADNNGVSPDAAAKPADAKRRARPAELSPVAIAKLGSPPALSDGAGSSTVDASSAAAATAAAVPEMPPHSQRPAGAVARQAMLADSLGARMAARRQQRMRERGAFEHGQGSIAGAPAATSSSAAVKQGGVALTEELNQIRAEREGRVQKLFAQLDRLAAYKGGSAKTGGERPLPKPNDAAGASTALVPYQGVGLQHDYQTTVLLNLLRGADSRKWLKEWLLEDGRVEKVREVIEKAPPELQYLLAGILGRRLDEVEEGARQKELEITLKGGQAVLAGKGSVQAPEERPLPKPMPQKKPLLLLTYRPSAGDAPAPSTTTSSSSVEVVELPAGVPKRLDAIVEEDDVLSSFSPAGNQPAEVYEAKADGSFELTAR